MSQILRKKILCSFKNLHKTSKQVFHLDEYALAAARQKINEEYKKNKNISDSGVIEELLKYAEAVEQELRINVIQAQEKQPGVYELKITKDTAKCDNFLFDENANLPPPRTKKCK